DPAASEIYPLSLHDALPISDRGSYFAPPDRRCRRSGSGRVMRLARNAADSLEMEIAHLRGLDLEALRARWRSVSGRDGRLLSMRSEEHTSELQSLAYLVCRL